MPNLSFEKLVTIKEKIGHFLLEMHISLGNDKETLRKVCRLGIKKANIVIAAKVVKIADLEGNHAYDLSTVIYEAVKVQMM